MCQGDLIIIRDALKEVIVKQSENRLWIPGTITMNQTDLKGFGDMMVNHKIHEPYQMVRIGELLDAIENEIHQDDSE